MGSFSSFFTPRRMNFNQSEKLKGLWKTSITNERGTRSLFVNMERSKLTASILSRYMNLQYIITTCKWIEKSFCINDEFELDGHSAVKMVDDVIKFNQEKEG